MKNLFRKSCAYWSAWLRARFQAAHWWLTCRRECAWCHRWLGGNPMSRRISHGMCPACFHRVARTV